MKTGELYYEICALPMLRLGEVPSISVSEFMAFCRSRLSAGVCDALEAASLEPDSPVCCRAQQAWRNWETAVRNGMVTLRAELLGLDASRWLRYEEDVFPSDVALFKGILEQEDPLTRQESLDALRWRELEHLTVGHEFDFDGLVVYKLKLLLAFRWAAVPVRDVRDSFGRLVEYGLQDAKSKCEIVKANVAI